MFLNRHLRSLLRGREGSAALEFALVAPIFFFWILGIIEIALVVWFQFLLTEGVDQASDYLRQQALTGASVTIDGVRSSICGTIQPGGLSCNADLLKVSVTDVSTPTDGSYSVPAAIDNTAFPATGDGKEYLVAIGYKWSVIFPTTHLLLQKNAQLQSFSVVVTSERVSE